MAHRAMDIVFAITAGALFALPMLCIAVAIRLTSPGPALHWSTRVGHNNTLFRMPKFRTMHLDAPDVATHLMRDPKRYLTPLGSLLRKTSMDELPQLWSILKGQMSVVGPRPALHNQSDLVAMRTQAGVHRLLPGLTGWAQVNGRDTLPLAEKVHYDAYYLAHRSMRMDIYILWLTFLRVLRKDAVSH